MFTGVYTALATPFNKQGQVDYPVLERLIQAQLAARTEALPPKPLLCQPRKRPKFYVFVPRG